MPKQSFKSTTNLFVCPQMTLLRRTSIELVQLSVFFFMFRLSACFRKYGHGLHGVSHHWQNCHHCHYCHFWHNCHHCVNFWYFFFVSANLHVSTIMALDLQPKHLFFQRSEKGELGMFWFVHTMMSSGKYPSFKISFKCWWLNICD